MLHKPLNQSIPTMTLNSFTQKKSNYHKNHTFKLHEQIWERNIHNLKLTTLWWPKKPLLSKNQEYYKDHTFKLSKCDKRIITLSSQTFYQVKQKLNFNNWQNPFSESKCIHNFHQTTRQILTSNKQKLKITL